jgi:hypothetical protein
MKQTLEQRQSVITRDFDRNLAYSAARTGGTDEREGHVADAAAATAASGRGPSAAGTGGSAMEQLQGGSQPAGRKHHAPPGACTMTSSWMLRRVALVRTDVSEELSASIIRVTRIGELGTTLDVTSNRRTLRRNTK